MSASLVVLFTLCACNKYCCEETYCCEEPPKCECPKKPSSPEEKLRPMSNQQISSIIGNQSLAQMKANCNNTYLNLHHGNQITVQNLECLPPNVTMTNDELIQLLKANGSQFTLSKANINSLREAGYNSQTIHRIQTVNQPKKEKENDYYYDEDD